jgi:1-deoxy-D-xylulose-5-phosphate reductoisomerase
MMSGHASAVVPRRQQQTSFGAGLDGGRKRVTILGATGSIGQNTLDLIGRNPDLFALEAVTANAKVDELADVAIRHQARLAVIADQHLYTSLKARLSGTGIEAAAGRAALLEAAARPADCVMAAIVGAAGLEPTLSAVAQGRRVALANKECLVSAGDIFMAAVRANGTELLPVDSEHSAALQAIEGSDISSIKRIILTASGGPFRTWSLAELALATPEAALHHPTWSMGRKLTIDSATLMNKGLEIIEAHHLFQVDPDRIEAVVHPQSIVHCLVEYADGSHLAQLANPDMRTPIALSLAWPGRMAAPIERLDLVKLGCLNFEAPDEIRFPAMRTARAALTRGGTATAVLNAANEVAVAAFLDRRVGFLQIAQLVANTLDIADRKGLLTQTVDLHQVLEVDRQTRTIAEEAIVRRFN